MMSKAKVFVDDKGNSMLFPAYIYDEDEFVPSSLWTVGMKIRSATGLKMQDGWIEIDRAKFPHIKTRIGHLGFAS